MLQGRTGIQELSRALRAGARGLFRSLQPAGGRAGSRDTWPFLQRLLEVLPVSGSAGHPGNARPTSLPTVTHSVAAHPHLTRWPCRGVPSQAMLTGCSLTCIITRGGQNTCTAKRTLVMRARSDQGKGRVPDPSEHQSWERPGSGGCSKFRPRRHSSCEWACCGQACAAWCGGCPGRPELVRRPVRLWCPLETSYTCWVCRGTSLFSGASR